MKLHRFNNDGIEVFQRFLDSLTTIEPAPWPESALTDPTYSQPVGAGTELEARTFESRMDLARYLHQKFSEAGVKVAASDKSLWAWIACLYFPNVCPRKAENWTPGAAQRWIPESGDWRRYYRHLFAGPWAIFRAHSEKPDRALAVLCQAPGRPGDVVEQLASRQEIVTSPAVMEVASQIFVDASTRKQKRGAGGKGAGSARRFVSVMNQFDVTWDLTAIGTSRLGDLLPDEFSSTN